VCEDEWREGEDAWGRQNGLEGNSKEGKLEKKFVKIVEARKRANTENITREAGDKRDGRGKHKTLGNRDMRRSVEERERER